MSDSHAPLAADMVEYLRKQGMDDIAEEIERLRERVTHLEAVVAAARGTLAEPEDRHEFGIIHDVAPNVPR